MRKDKIESSDKTALQSNSAERDNLVKDAELLEALKRTMLTKDGEKVIKWILKLTKVLLDPFDNSGRTYFALGEQNIGRQLLFMLVDTGMPINIADIAPELNSGRLDDIHKKIAILNTKITEESK